MEIKHPLDAAMINLDGVTGLDNAREFAGGEGMGERQTDNLLLDVDRHLGGHRRLPTAVLEGASIQQARDAIMPKPLQITPQAFIGEASYLALL
jgi:hypothetical protein